MRIVFACFVSLFLMLSFTAQLSAQQTQAAPAAGSTSASPVPRLIKFSGVLLDHQGQPLKGPVGVTFSLYAQQSGDSPLWMETQNVELDEKGVYTVLLGASTATSLPEELFSTGEARWLGIQPEREPELPRVLLVSAPYALKAADADTLGGLPASAFVLAGVPTIATNGSSSSPTSETTASVTSLSSSSAMAPAVGTIPVTTAGGTVNMLAKFDAAADITKSLIFDNGTNVGIGNTTPAAKLDVSGSGIFRGFLQLPATGTANSTTKGFDSQPFDFLASVFNGAAAVNQHFRWQAEPVNPGLAAASGKLNLLFASGTGTPAETGLSIGNNGRITFASGQTFPGTGTITGVIAGTDLTGGGTTGNVTLNLDTTKVPRLAAANTFTANQSVIGTVTATNVTATGIVTGGVVDATSINAIGAVNSGVVNATTSFEIGGTPFAYGSYANGNALLGFAGNSTMTGTNNTASGLHALISNTTGAGNTANGQSALYANTTGSLNTASGYSALQLNTTGQYNTASGYNALGSNRMGNGNTASGFDALLSNASGSDNTATGASALYSCTGNYNTASGWHALYANTLGGANTASGFGALSYNTTGEENTANGTATLTSNTTGSSLTCIGYACNVAVDGLTNATAIGAHAFVGRSNSLVLGGTGVYAVNVGIGTTTPAASILTIGQGLGFPLADGWATYSSRRWKTNIHTLHDALATVEQLRGVSYDLKANGKHEVGVIAEEVGAVVPEVVTWDEDGKDAQSVDYGRLTALLIEATKEQQALIHQQQEQIKAQQVQLSKLTSELRTIQVLFKTNQRTNTKLHKVKIQQAVGHRAPPTLTQAESTRVATSTTPSFPLN